jgi:hypothetical protein
VKDELRRHGLLLMQDKQIVSVVGLIAGEPLKGSWWSHPRGREMFATQRQLTEDRDTLVSRLIAGKVTYVHRRLWPSFLAVATSGDEWQKRGLRAKPSKDELQERLLVAAEEVHTESGRHELQIQSWQEWAAEHGAKIPRVTPAAYETLEKAAVKIGATPKMLPWNRF